MIRRSLVAFAVALFAVAAIAQNTPLQSAAVANGNGTTFDVSGYSVAVLTVNCATCSGGTTINFEGSEDASNWTAVNAAQLGTTTIATSTTTAGVSVWEVSVSGLQLIRARISAYSAGTITITAHGSGRPWSSRVVNANITGNTATNQSTNIAQVGGNTVVTGGVNGSVGVGGTEANNVVPAANPVRLAGYSWTDGTAPTVTTAGRVTDLLTTTDHRLVVTTDHPKRVHCRLTTTATTSTLITNCAAPGAGLSIYITDINITGGAAVGATAAASIQYGTGGSCGTGTTVVFDCQHAATSGCTSNLSTPIKAAANAEICILDATTGTKFVNVTGFIAP